MPHLAFFYSFHLQMQHRTESPSTPAEASGKFDDCVVSVFLIQKKDHPISRRGLDPLGNSRSPIFAGILYSALKIPWENPSAASMYF